MENIVKSVYWTSRAVKNIEKITRFNANLYGFEQATDIAIDFRKSTQILENLEFDYLKVGKIDVEFLHLKRNYRKLINHYC